MSAVSQRSLSNFCILRLNGMAFNRCGGWTVRPKSAPNFGNPYATPSPICNAAPITLSAVTTLIRSLGRGIGCAARAISSGHLPTICCWATSKFPQVVMYNGALFTSVLASFAELKTEKLSKFASSLIFPTCCGRSALC